MQISEVRKLVGKNLGFDLDGSPGSVAALSQADAVRVGDGIANYILSNPGLFTADQIAGARKIANADDFGQPLRDTSFDWGMFGSEVSNTFGNWSQWVKWLAFGALGLFLYNLAMRPKNK